MILNQEEIKRMGCDNDMQLSHTEQLVKLRADVDMLKDIFSVIKDLHVSIVDMHGDYKTTLILLQTQGEAIKLQNENQRKVIDKVENLETLMVNKDSLSRLYDKIEIIQEEVDTMKIQPAKDAYEQAKSIKRLLIGVAIVLFGGLVFLGLSVIWYMIKSGAINA